MRRERLDMCVSFANIISADSSYADMPQREAAVSETIEYETSACTNCEETVFVDTEGENVDELQEGVPVVLTGGSNMTADVMGSMAAAKQHRIPRTVLKLFGLNEEGAGTAQSYLCPACAKSVYSEDTQ